MCKAFPQTSPFYLTAVCLIIPPVTVKFRSRYPCWQISPHPPSRSYGTYSLMVCRLAKPRADSPISYVCGPFGFLCGCTWWECITILLEILHRSSLVKKSSESWRDPAKGPSGILSSCFVLIPLLSLLCHWNRFASRYNRVVTGQEMVREKLAFLKVRETVRRVYFGARKLTFWKKVS